MEVSWTFSAVALLAGIASGVVGFVPIFLVSRLKDPYFRARMVYLGLIGTGFSLLLFLGMFIICKSVASEMLLCYGVSTIVTFLIVACVFAGIRTFRH